MANPAESKTVNQMANPAESKIDIYARVSHSASDPYYYGYEFSVEVYDPKRHDIWEGCGCTKESLKGKKCLFPHIIQSYSSYERAEIPGFVCCEKRLTQQAKNFKSSKGSRLDISCFKSQKELLESPFKINQFFIEGLEVVYDANKVLQGLHGYFTKEQLEVLNKANIRHYRYPRNGHTLY